MGSGVTARPAANDGKAAASASNIGRMASATGVSLKVEDRTSLELILAFVGPVGSGVSTTAEALKTELENKYGYQVEIIKVSNLIRKFASDVGESIDDTLVGTDRINRYQTVGNLLRERRGADYLADRAIEQIALMRQKNHGFQTADNGIAVPIQRRAAYIIDSLKNPAEVSKLNKIYGDLFWLVTVFAPHKVRERRLTSGGLDDAMAREVMKRDQEEEESSGQKVSRTAHLADYFIRNHKDTRERIELAIKRFLEVIFATELHTPTFEEQGMMKAAAAAIQSACMSRQVGASIYDASGELLGVGCNDVPMAGGGLYSEATGREDNRCFKWGGKVCHNDERKAKLARQIATSISGEDTASLGTNLAKVAGSDAKNLIEFSRSVHVEMEAIVSVARSGAGPTVNGTLFTTTFPCHNCARHIVAAGVKKVVFIEPYSKSLAIELHHDSISLSEEPNKVHFLQYEGFSPRVAIRVFTSSGRARKDGGKFVAIQPRTAPPIFPFPLDSYINSERMVVQQLTEK